jgi:hypothetical protein
MINHFWLRLRLRLRLGRVVVMYHVVVVTVMVVTTNMMMWWGMRMVRVPMVVLTIQFFFTASPFCSYVPIHPTCWLGHCKSRCIMCCIQKLLF